LKYKKCFRPQTRCRSSHHSEKKQTYHLDLHTP
jgi:hypothetical protein